MEFSVRNKDMSYFGRIFIEIECTRWILSEHKIQQLVLSNLGTNIAAVIT